MLQEKQTHELGPAEVAGIWETAEQGYTRKEREEIEKLEREVESAVVGKEVASRVSEVVIDGWRRNEKKSWSIDNADVMRRSIQGKMYEVLHPVRPMYASHRPRTVRLVPLSAPGSPFELDHRAEMPEGLHRNSPQSLFSLSSKAKAILQWNSELENSF